VASVADRTTDEGLTEALGRPSDDEIAQLDAWWRASNHLTIDLTQCGDVARVDLPPDVNTLLSVADHGLRSYINEQKLAEHKTYVVEHLEDMPEIRDRTLGDRTQQG
jgi:phosphoketolase